MWYKEHTTPSLNLFIFCNEDVVSGSNHVDPTGWEGFEDEEFTGVLRLHRSASNVHWSCFKQDIWWRLTEWQTILLRIVHLITHMPAHQPYTHPPNQKSNYPVGKFCRDMLYWKFCLCEMSYSILWKCSVKGTKFCGQNMLNEMASIFNVASWNCSSKLSPLWHGNELISSMCAPAYILCLQHAYTQRGLFPLHDPATSLLVCVDFYCDLHAFVFLKKINKSLRKLCHGVSHILSKQ